MRCSGSKRVAADVEVFNLTVAGPEHSYFAFGIAVHNKTVELDGAHS